MRRTIAFPLVALAAALVACGSTKPASESDAEKLEAKTQAAVKRFKDQDSTISKWFETAYGYAVFPSVAKAGLVVGGAGGRGQVYEQGEHVGYTTLSQGTFGLQAGAQEYSEIIFFKDKWALNAFKEGNFEFSAQASAVAIEQGSAAKADYSGGVAVFTCVAGGLMAEASIGGQKFSYEPKS